MQSACALHETATEFSSTSRPTIGLLLCRPLTDSRSFQVWSGVCAAARQRDLNVICFPLYTHMHGDREQNNILLRLISQRRIQGVAVYHWWSDLAEFEANLAPLPDIPIISLTHLFEGHYGVVDDNYGGMRLAVEHLITAHHCRRLAYIHGPEGCQPSEERFRGYIDGLAAHGIPVDERLITPRLPLFLWDSGMRALSQLIDERRLRPGVDFDAIVTRSDHLAFTILDELRRRGIRVPYDVAVVGYDNMDECQTMMPPLTSVVLPFYELGQRAVQMLADLFAGQSLPAPHVIVPPQLMVRQSCGCLPASVIQVRSPIGQAVRSASESLHDADLPEFLYQFANDIGASMRSRDQMTSFLEAFTAELHGAPAGTFLASLDMLLRGMVAGEQEVAIWQTILSEFRRQMTAILSPDDAQRAESLWHQARMMIEEAILWAAARRHERDVKYAETLRDFSQALITTFDIEGIMAILAQKLPLLGIERGIVSLYDSADDPTTLARVIMAYDENGRIEVQRDRAAFATRELAPDEVWPQHFRYHLIVKPLYFQQTPIGLAVLETGAQDRNLYETVRGELSSALQGALLVQRVQERSAEIARQKYILDTFLENVPDSIYFKDRESRITHANLAHARLMGFHDPREELGKSDFDFFSEELARLKYEQEQAILRTGKPLLALEEPDAQGRWSLTTKMPLQDECGEIIGTFGILRDITPLKQAQRQLEDAYIEIQQLNEQLKQENLRMSAELDVARRLQQMVLPVPEELNNISGLDIVGYMQPAEEVGGDYYDVLPCQRDGHVCIGIGDVTGHGLESGVLMLMTQTAIRTLVDRGETDPVIFLNTLNRVLYQNIKRMRVDRSLTLAMVNYQNGQLRLIGQHEEALVVRRNGRIVRINTMNLGFPLGMVADIRQWVAETTISLTSGDGVVLYTDGITEAQNARGKFYGLERLCAVISANWREKNAEGVKQAIVDDLRAFVGGAQMYDDVTLVVLKKQ